MNTVNEYNIMRSNVEPSNNHEQDCSEIVKSFFRNIIADVNKGSPMKQIYIGAGSGWIIGIATIRIGKMSGYLLGSGFILLQIAAHRGYIDVNWDKIKKKIEKISDKVDKEITGQGPQLLKKIERFVEEVGQNRAKS